MRGRGPNPVSTIAASRDSRSGVRGQTLVEVLIGSGLLAFLFVALFGAFDAMLATNRLSSDITRATLDAERVISELEATPFDQLRDYVPPTLESLRDEFVTVAVTTEAGASIAAGDPLPSIVRVGVTVTWMDWDSISQEVALYTLRGDY